MWSAEEVGEREEMRQKIVKKMLTPWYDLLFSYG